MTALPTREEIEALVAYLPQLYADGFQPIVRWDGGEKTKEGYITMPWPVYDPLVEQFFTYKPCWLDYNYAPETAGKMLKDEERVKTATLEEIKSMLTFCVRGERFSSGHWGVMIEGGHIRRLLERLVEIRSEMDQASNRE